MTVRQTTVRFTGEQHDWLRRRAFDLNQPQQLVIEDALVAAGMPRGSARTGDVVDTLPLPDGVKDFVDRDGCLWARAGLRRWQRYTLSGHVDHDEPATGASDLLRRFGPLRVGKLRGQ